MKTKQAHKSFKGASFKKPNCYFYLNLTQIKQMNKEKGGQISLNVLCGFLNLKSLKEWRWCCGKCHQETEKKDAQAQTQKVAGSHPSSEKEKMTCYFLPV